MENNKDLIDHISDFGKGLTSFFATTYNFGDFLERTKEYRLKIKILLFFFIYFLSIPYSLCF